MYTALLRTTLLQYTPFLDIYLISFVDGVIVARALGTVDVHSPAQDYSSAVYTLS